MNVRMSLVFASALVAAASVVHADPIPYILGSGPGEPGFIYHGPEFGSHIGGVYFEVGHLQDLEGLATIQVMDTAFSSQTSGLYCQDVNEDGVCGDDGTVGGVVEPNVPFCGGIVLDALLPNWYITSDVQIYLDSPAWGSPVLSPCGFQPSFATQGEVAHT